MKIDIERDALVELFLFMTAMIPEYMRKPTATMYQLCRIMDVYKQIEEALNEEQG